jgi:hypothetical protein
VFFIFFLAKLTIYLLVFQIKRIPEYDKYLSDLLDDTDSSLPEYHELATAANRIRQVGANLTPFGTFTLIG